MMYSRKNKENRFKASVIGILALAALAASAAAQPERGVTLYRGGDYTGESQTFGAGAEVARLEGSAIGNDHASSVRVGPGCSVTLYEHPDFRGVATILSEDEPDLRFTEIGNDRVSALRVECRGFGTGGHGAAGQRWVVLYSDANFRGRDEAFDSDDPDLGDNLVRSNTASSIRVPEGCEAVLYDDPGFRGNTAALSADVADLTRTRVGNDQVSSLTVRCAGARPGWYGAGADERPGYFNGGAAVGPGSGRLSGAVLFTESEFRGREEAFASDDPDLRDNLIRQATASSVRVAEGCVAILYADANYRGRMTILTEDAPRLDRTAVGNDRISSLEIRCDEGEGVTLYQHVSYAGRSETFTGDDPQLSDNAVRHDEASSVRVPRGCVATLWEHPDYRGRSVTLRGDAADLGRTPVGNDTVSSIQVDCQSF